MAGASHQVQELERMAKELKNLDAVKTVKDSLGDGALPSHLWPLMGQVFAASPYATLHQLMYDACDALKKFSKALGETLDAVAQDYREKEQQHGQDFSHVDE